MMKNLTLERRIWTISLESNGRMMKDRHLHLRQVSEGLFREMIRRIGGFLHRTPAPLLRICLLLAFRSMILPWKMAVFPRDLQDPHQHQDQAFSNSPVLRCLSLLAVARGAQRLVQDWLLLLLRAHRRRPHQAF